MKSRTRQELIEHLQYIGKKIGETPKKKHLAEYNNGQGFGKDAYLNHFSSFAEALQLAGFEPNVCLEQDEEFFLKEVYRVYKKLNHYPSTREFNENSNINYELILNKFLSDDFTWKDFCIKAGVPKEIIPQNERPSEEEVFKYIKDIVKELKDFPKYKQVKKIIRPYETKCGTFYKAMLYLGFAIGKTDEENFGKLTVKDILNEKESEGK